MNDRIKRMVAALIDYYILCFLSTAMIYIVTLGELTVTLFTVILYFLTFFVLLLLKDFTFKNASVGKKILKMFVIKIDGSKFTLTDAFKRTICLIILPPIEAVLLVVNDKRIGDSWAKTTVVSEQ